MSDLIERLSSACCAEDLNPEEVDAIVEARAFIEAHSWVSVKDRLPENSGVYLCRIKDENLIINIRWWDKWLDDNDEEIAVTHWMPIPAMEADK